MDLVCLMLRDVLCFISCRFAIDSSVDNSFKGWLKEITDSLKLVSDFKGLDPSLASYINGL